MSDDVEEKWNPNNFGEKRRRIWRKWQWGWGGDKKVIDRDVTDFDTGDEEDIEEINDKIESDETIVNAEEEELHHSIFKEYNDSSYSNNNDSDH